jgi:hypothetical protein
VRLNDDLGGRDGSLTLWLDGREVQHVTAGLPGTWVHSSFWPEPQVVPYTGFTPGVFEGFRFRSADTLALNFVNLQHYVTWSDVPASTESSVGYDQLVIATDRIGCR